MKLTVKTLQQKTFTIESLDQDSVLDLKKKIQESQGFAPDLQKLIHSGKILNDESLVKDLNIQEKDFLVVMVTKPKAASQAPVETVTQSTPATVATVPTPASAPVSAPAPSQTESAESTDLSLSGSTGIATGSAYEAAVSGLVEMGFEREQVVRAMRAAFNNPDRAAEYLMTVSLKSLNSSRVFQSLLKDRLLWQILSSHRKNLKEIKVQYPLICLMQPLISQQIIILELILQLHRVPRRN